MKKQNQKLPFSETTIFELIKLGKYEKAKELLELLIDVSKSIDNAILNNRVAIIDVNRSAVTGKYVTKKFAKKHPRTTVKESK